LVESSLPLRIMMPWADLSAFRAMMSNAGFRRRTVGQRPRLVRIRESAVPAMPEPPRREPNAASEPFG
jgi:hypothetical protein